jgi:L-cysteine desulfidase
METNPMAIALVGVIGGILVCMIGLLIAMVVGLKKDIENRDNVIFNKITAIQDRLIHMVLAEDYKGDKKEIELKLDEHGDRILTLEIKVRDNHEK